MFTNTLRLLSFISLFFVCLANGQEFDNWYFGNKAGLNFSSDSPVPLLDGQMDTPEGCATMSDSNGQLLFYTNGNTVWNKNHQIMLNGTDLLGNPSSVQTVAIPNPENDYQYYLFTVDANGGENGMNYSIIDMTADGGLGEVIIKNIHLVTPVTERITATWHANGTDIWVVAHGWYNDAFYAYKVTELGVEPPVISNVGAFIGDSIGDPWGVDAQATLKFSQQGNRLANTIINSGNSFSDSQIQLFDFDNATGIISNPVSILTPYNASIGVEFSPSGNFLYANQVAGLTQYNLLVNDITSSAISVGTNVNMYTIQLGPDQKIYRVSPDLNTISVINNPDLLGTACDYQHNSVNLGTGISRSGLPFVLPPFLAIDTENICFEESNSFTFMSSIENLDSVFWDFGDGFSSNETAPQHTYNQSGTYQVTLTITKQNREYKTYKTVVVSPLPTAYTAPDIILCDEFNDGEELFDLLSQNPVILGTQPVNEYTITYHLSSDDAENNSNNIGTLFENTSNPQTVFARVTHTETGCYAISSFQIQVINSPVLEMENQYLCKNEPLTLTAPNGFISYEWSTGETSQTIQISQAGNYSLTRISGYKRNCL